MINEIPTLLANLSPSDLDGLWYIDPSFRPVTIPREVAWIYDIVIGDHPEKTVPQAMCILKCVDMQAYKSVFDSRELFDYPSGTSIKSLIKNKDANNTLSALANNKKPVYTLFSGDDYLKGLFSIYSAAQEGVVRLCCILLALAYRLKQARLSNG